MIASPLVAAPFAPVVDRLIWWVPAVRCMVVSAWFQIGQLYPTGSHTSSGLPPSARGEDVGRTRDVGGSRVTPVEHGQLVITGLRHGHVERDDRARSGAQAAHVLLARGGEAAEVAGRALGVDVPAGAGERGLGRQVTVQPGGVR